MELRISEGPNQPSFKRLIWNEKYREKTQFAISEVMRQDSYNQGAISFDVLEDQFNKIDDLKDDVVLNCTYFGSSESGVFSMIAFNKAGSLLADLTVTTGSEPKKANKTLSGFYDLVKTKLEVLKNTRQLSANQEFYYETADEYMKIFDRNA